MQSENVDKEPLIAEDRSSQLVRDGSLKRRLTFRLL